MTTKLENRRSGLEGRTARLGELFELAFQGRERCSADAAGIIVRDICDDSRRATAGTIFAALNGTKAKGTAYVRDAVDRGAVAVLTDSAEVSDDRAVFVRVRDARHALARLAAAHYGLTEIQASGKLPIVGVTGTNGKSTTTYMMRQLLRTAKRTPALLGTIEYDLVGRMLVSSLTTPDPVTLTRHLVEAYDDGADCAVMEVSSHSLDQRRADGIEFSVAVFTNLTQDHLDYHQTIDNYLAAKRRLFESLAPTATAIVNADDPSSEKLLEGCKAKVMRYGLSNRADLRGRIVREDLSGGRFFLTTGKNEIEMHTPMVGRHNIYNALAAACAVHAMGVDWETIRRGTGELNDVPGRLQRVPTGDLGFEVFVDYAHTDDALRNALSAVRPLTRGRLWCVFGCGGDRDRGKRPLMARAVAECTDRFIITSDNPRTEKPEAIIEEIKSGLNAADMTRGEAEPDRASAIHRAIGKLEPGDLLVIAGKGHEDYQILGERKIHFDDREIASQAIAGLREKRRDAGPCNR